MAATSNVPRSSTCDGAQLRVPRQGSRLAWCSTAVVTTTSSLVRRSRKASRLSASVVLRGKSARCVAGSPPTKRTMISRASS